MGKNTVTLSKDLPGGKVTVPDGSSEKSYYKYFLEPFEDISAELKATLRSSVFKKGQGGLEPEDRKKLQEIKRWPEKDGVYYLKRGGCVVCSNVKVPNITGDMLGWWAGWHGYDPLRYAIWDPEDHYSLILDEASRKRIEDSTIPPREKLWGMKHKSLESFDREPPSWVEMEFLCPWDVGYDKSLDNTDRCQYILCAKSKLNGKIPVFMTENLVKGEDGINEIRLRFWIGYELQEDGHFTCSFPFFLKLPPAKLVSLLMLHNHREYFHINKILPRIYEENKDNWTE